MLVRAIFASPGMNQNEIAYASQVLEPGRESGVIQWWAFEGLKFRLAEKTHYTVDFVVVFADGHVEGHEIKALWLPSKKKLRTDPSAKPRVGWTEDARIKIKAAASLFPWIQFKGVHADELGRWQYEEFSARPTPQGGAL